MESRKKEGLWKRTHEDVHRILRDLKADSVASNPRKPVDCCNLPTLPGAGIKEPSE